MINRYKLMAIRLTPQITIEAYIPDEGFLIGARLESGNPHFYEDVYVCSFFLRPASV